LKIHAKIMSKVKPEDPLDTKINVFDYEVGANFKLKIKQQNIKLGGKEVKVPNYDSSEFSEKTPVVNPATNEPMSDEELDALDEKLTALAPIVGKDKFKSYDELAVLFTKKTGIVVATSPDGAAPVAVAAPIEAPKTAALATKVASAVEPDEEDDDDAFLNSLRQ